MNNVIGLMKKLRPNKWWAMAGVLAGIVALAVALPLKDYCYQTMDFLTIARLTEDIAGNSRTETVAALFARLQQTVSNADGQTYRPLQYAAEIIDYGYVSCDQSAWLLSEMCWHKKIPAHVLYLFRPGEEVSCHTVACVYIDDRWRVVDPSRRELLRDAAGGFPALADIISGEMELDENYRRLFIKHRLADHGVNKFFQLLFAVRYGFIPEKYHYDYGPSGPECLTRRTHHFLTLPELFGG